MIDFVYLSVLMLLLVLVTMIIEAGRGKNVDFASLQSNIKMR